MKKTYKLENLDCAHCAQKMEDAANALDIVTKCEINFMMSKMKLEAEDDKFEKALNAVVEVIKKVEPDCIVVK